jgi:ferredoxin-NADP reductase
MDASCMMGVLRNQLYPQLMELPALTPEMRQKIEADARARINAANAAIVHAQDQYHRAMVANDTAAMAAAASRQREALADLNSGTAALRALAENRAPRQIALSWFREQMNLLTPGEPAAEMPGPFGLSWLHVVSMAAAGVLVLAMLGAAVARRRRASALLNRLSAAPQVAPVSMPVTPPMRPAPITSPPATPRPGVRPAIWSGLLRVAAIARETPHVKTFRIAAPDGSPIPFTFAPGQFLTLSVRVDQGMVHRSYTIASPPSRAAYVEVTVKREDDGAVSRFLHDRVAVGDQLQVRAPAGIFTFEGTDADSIVLIAGGVGITPMMCVIRHLTDISWPGEIFLFFATRSSDEVIFREELEYLQRRHARLHVVAAVDERAEGTAWMGLEGRITKETLMAAVPRLASRRIHLCGPPPMMTAIRRILDEIGVPGSQIKTEAFGPALGLVPPPQAEPPVPPKAVERVLDKVEAPRAAPGEMPVMGPATATLSFARSAKSAPLPPDKTVLEVAESIGVPIDYSCRVGTCGLCKTKLLAGQVKMEFQEALTEDDKTAGIILACQARSLGNVTVDA